MYSILGGGTPWGSLGVLYDVFLYDWKTMYLRDVVNKTETKKNNVIRQRTVWVL